MSPNKSRIKGDAWEHDLVELLKNSLEGTFKRVPGSGSLGTNLDEPLLSGDVVAKFNGIDRVFRIECKTRGGGKQITVEREWFNKIKQEAENTYSLPMLACKFLGARRADGVQYFIAFDFDTFVELINYINSLKKKLDEQGK